MIIYTYKHISTYIIYKNIITKEREREIEEIEGELLGKQLGGVATRPSATSV